jgi:hypothetical protein
MTASSRHPTLEVIEREWASLNEVLDGLAPEQMEHPVYDPELESEPWTVKDLLVHMAGWKRNAIRVIDMLKTDPSSVPSAGTPDVILQIDGDAFNREMYERSSAGSVEDAMAEHRAAHSELMAALGSLPSEQIPQPTSPNIWPYPAIWHVRMHRMDTVNAAGGASD